MPMALKEDNKMIIEYNVVCFERTLTIELSDKYENLKEEILKDLDKFYDWWQNNDNPDMCLEEYMVEMTCIHLDLTVEEWDSIPYGDSDYEPRETMWVCERCLAGIEYHEGNQATLRHGVDEMDAIESKCDWCKSCGHDTLYELV
jgi:hypothetical protein